VIPPPRSTLPVRVSVVGLPRAFPHAELAHDRRLMRADLSETEQWVAEPRPASCTRRTARRRPPCRW
jgi:hypothetical protein